jgi:hypothetical protein
MHDGAGAGVPGSEGCGDDRRAAVHHLHGAMPLLGLLPPCTLRGVEYLPAGQVPEWRLPRAGERQRVDVVGLVGDVVLVAGLPTRLLAPRSGSRLAGVDLAAQRPGAGCVGRDATSLPLATVCVLFLVRSITSTTWVHGAWPQVKPVLRQALKCDGRLPKTAGSTGRFGRGLLRAVGTLGKWTHGALARHAQPIES